MLELPRKAAQQRYHHEPQSALPLAAQDALTLCFQLPRRRLAVEDALLLRKVSKHRRRPAVA
jgi:hypothetical protein